MLHGKTPFGLLKVNLTGLKHKMSQSEGDISMDPFEDLTEIMSPRELTRRFTSFLHRKQPSSSSVGKELTPRSLADSIPLKESSSPNITTPRRIQADNTPLYFASEELRQHSELALESMKTCSKLLGYLISDLNDDKEQVFVLDAVKKCSQVVTKTAEALQYNVELVTDSIASHKEGRRKPKVLPRIPSRRIRVYEMEPIPASTETQTVKKVTRSRSASFHSHTVIKKQLIQNNEENEPPSSVTNWHELHAKQGLFQSFYGSDEKSSFQSPPVIVPRKSM